MKFTKETHEKRFTADETELLRVIWSIPHITELDQEETGTEISCKLFSDFYLKVIGAALDFAENTLLLHLKEEQSKRSLHDRKFSPLRYRMVLDFEGKTEADETLFVTLVFLLKQNGKTVFETRETHCFKQRNGTLVLTVPHVPKRRNRRKEIKTGIK